jgi:hypothetical protein
MAPPLCPLCARSAGQRRELMVTPGQPGTPAHLRTGWLTRCANRLSKQKVRPYFASHEILTARNAGYTRTPLPPGSLNRVPSRQRHLLARVMAKRQDVQSTPTTAVGCVSASPPWYRWWWSSNSSASQRLARSCLAGAVGQCLMQQRLQEPLPLRLCAGQGTLQLIAYGHQFIHLGDDSILLGQRRNREEYRLKVGGADPPIPDGRGTQLGNC